MKSKFFIFLGVVLALFLVLGVTAYATDDITLQEMTVTYTKQEIPDQDVETVPSRPVYEISIPSVFSLNEANTLPLYLTENNIPDGKALQVCIDGEKTIQNDTYLHLEGTKGQTPAKVVIGCYSSSGVEEYLDFWGKWGIACFISGNSHPVNRGTIFFKVVNDEELIADTYTGTVHFSMMLIDESLI